jgi:hypothetical protein
MGSFYEMIGWDPYYEDPKFPFRKIFNATPSLFIHDSFFPWKLLLLTWFHAFFDLTFYTVGKFEHPLSQFFAECMHDLVARLKSQPGLLHAFRMAARNLALDREGATDCLHYVFHHADAENDDVDDDDDEGESDSDNE